VVLCSGKKDSERDRKREWQKGKAVRDEKTSDKESKIEKAQMRKKRKNRKEDQETERVTQKERNKD
jgi:hypothetical protein